jgi:hypothetical protein
MIFEETINKYKNEVEAAINQLYVKAFENQVYDTNLLLVLENGLKKEHNEATIKRLGISPSFSGYYCNWV